MIWNQERRKEGKMIRQNLENYSEHSVDSVCKLPGFQIDR